VKSTLLWFSGPVRSGKTTALIRQYAHWAFHHPQPPVPSGHGQSPPHLESRGTALIFAANGDNRQHLFQMLAQVTGSKALGHTTTPLAFFEDEVELFWPIILAALQVVPQFPLRLRPEMEQVLAAQLWADVPWEALFKIEPISRDRWIRRALDLFQLTAFRGMPLEQLSAHLEQGFTLPPIVPMISTLLTEMLAQWRDWCLAQGLLTYGIVTELFWRYLLPDVTYQNRLCERFNALFADDVDNYPAITRDLFALLLDRGVKGVFTYNPDGAIRLGLGADPEALLSLSNRLGHPAQIEDLTPPVAASLGATIGAAVVDFLQMPQFELPAEIQTIQTNSRAQMLRQTAETIIAAVHAGEVQPQDIAVIGPGLDTIARYTLIEILERQGIAVESLKDQRPLHSAAIIRALLTLLALVYPGLGRYIDAEQVAEMLVVLTAQPNAPAAAASARSPQIDPVRAGLLTDHCFQPHPDNPQLLPVTAFPRWDRLGQEATTAYTQILNWWQHQRQAFQISSPAHSYLTLSPVFVLDRAIQQFFAHSSLRYDQLALLRELMETAQHYWQVDERLRQTPTHRTDLQTTVGQFIQLLRQGTLTANPYPPHPLGHPHSAVILATTFQYRAARPSHRWQFWLDAGSAFWHGGGAVVLWGAPTLLRGWSGQPETVEDQINRDQEQLRRLVWDLLSRAQERVYLCHSELSVSGQEQMGPLLPLVDAAAIPKR
jgi:hypothetical protein